MSTLTLPPLPGLVPCARQLVVPIVEQTRLARDTYRLRLASPELANAVVPGQFFMVRPTGQTDPLLGRPFALYDVWLDATGEPGGIDLVYLVVGKMTGVMRTWQAGESVEIWGPLGNGFPLPTCDKLLVVAGGIGNTPFPAVLREALGLHHYGTEAGLEHGPRQVARPLSPADITLCYGVRTAEFLAGIDHFESLGIDLKLATDDGSRGHKGFVTQLAEEWLKTHTAPPAAGRTGPKLAVYCCGPEPMMHAVARLAAKYQAPCWLSLESPMACGFGACFSCVTKVKQPDGDWDYRRTCVEGPIFPAEVLDL
ncbi:MAG: dihydroorotate dehydrogenase electron transfer subunit [Planctomycetota bacterium]|nr:dihydroorotate dehydrogenase electron transfer subunit [Planctomycetota bacterium]